MQHFLDARDKLLSTKEQTWKQQRDETWSSDDKQNPCSSLKTGDFPNHSSQKSNFFLELSPDEAPLCLFKQTLIRLVDFYWLSKKERSQVERDVKQSETKGSTKLSLFDLVIWEMCSLSCPYTPHHHLIILHLPPHTHTHTHASALSMQTRACLSFCFSKRPRPRETQREKLWDALPTFLSI